MDFRQIRFLILINVNQNSEQDINMEKEEETKIKSNHNRSTNPSEQNFYENPDLDNPTSKMIEEYIEKTYPKCELADELDSFNSNRCSIPTQ